MFMNKETKVRFIDATKGPYILASFKASYPPTLWYYDLKKMKTATICLKEKEGEWDLGSCNSDGEFTLAAHFEERDAAERAYFSVQKKLMKEPFFPQFGSWGRIFVVVTIVLTFFLLWIAPAYRQVILKNAGMTASQEITDQPKEIIEGVPMTANDVLILPKD